MLRVKNDPNHIHSEWINLFNILTGRAVAVGGISGQAWRQRFAAAPCDDIWNLQNKQTTQIPKNCWNCLLSVKQHPNLYSHKCSKSVYIFTSSTNSLWRLRMVINMWNLQNEDYSDSNKLLDMIFKWEIRFKLAFT